MSQRILCCNCKEIIYDADIFCPFCGVNQRPIQPKIPCCNCKKAIPDNALFCRFCATNQRPTNLPIQPQVYCSNCKKAFFDTELTCPFCGVNQPPNQPQVPCPKCKKTIPDNASFCGFCGTNQRPIQQTVPTQLFCCKCKEPISNNDLFCPYCGTNQRPIQPQLNQQSFSRYLQAINPQTLLIIRLASIFLSTFLLFLPWVSILFLSVSGWEPISGKLILFCLSGLLGLTAYEHYIDKNSSVLRWRSIIWSFCFACSLSLFVYWLSLPYRLHIELTLPVFTVISLAMALLELYRLELNRRKITNIISISFVVIGLLIGIIDGQLNSKDISSNDSFPFMDSPESKKNEALVDVSVINWRVVKQIGSDYSVYSSSPGKKYIIAAIKVKNRSSEQVKVTSDSFEMECSNRNLYPSNSLISGYGYNPISATLLTDGETSGEIIFEVDQLVDIGTIRYHKF